MKYERLLVIPGNCLFPDHKNLSPDNNSLLFMAEDYGMCSRFKYHKHKLILLLSAMRTHRDFLIEEYKVEYIELDKRRNYFATLLSTLQKYKIDKVVTYELPNRGFVSKLEKFCADNGFNLTLKRSPMFINRLDEFEKYRKNSKRLLMNDFYIHQRKKHRILVDGEDNPFNGKWNFDSENRKKLPEDIKIPLLPKVNKTGHTDQVCKIVEKEFAENPGASECFFIPTTRKDALLWFDSFLEERFADFGPYEDAISQKESFVFHSLLSPLLNLGLLTPLEVVNRAVGFAKQNKVPFQSLEGFVRQIIGWREFVLGVYYTEDLRGNFFNHKRKLKDCWYDGTTGLKPLDDTIKKVLKNGYCHHIERLMIISSLMLLCEIHPGEVYRWFMEMFIDAYHWVMVPNIYGMGQFADGGIFATKPYVSGSSYILKMSDYKKGEWCEIWDGLYWRFIDKNKDFFRQNQRMSMMVSMLEKLESDRKKRIFEKAEKFIKSSTD